MVLTDAEATLAAARITAEATRCAGWISGVMGLVGGLLVVLGAFKVGKAQVKTQEYQNKILEKQDEILRANFHLERAKLKFDLFDRRFELFTETRNFVYQMLRIFHDCKSDNSKKHMIETHISIGTILNKNADFKEEAFFLFEQIDVYEKINKIHNIVDAMKNEAVFYNLEINSIKCSEVELLKEWRLLLGLLRNHIVMEDVNLK